MPTTGHRLLLLFDTRGGPRRFIYYVNGRHTAQPKQLTGSRRHACEGDSYDKWRGRKCREQDEESSERDIASHLK